MQIDHSTRDGCIVVALTGHVNLRTAPQIQRVLLKDLSERPYAIICDLAGVERIDPACAAVFSTVASHPATDWPTTNFLLCGARSAVAAVLRRVGVPRFLPLHETVEDALDEVAAIPPYLRDELQLPATAAAPSVARLYVRDVLRYWGPALPGDAVIDRVELLADALVGNAVAHAGAPLRLRLELRGDLLHLAVHDAEPRLLRLVPADPGAGPRLGRVERLATAWGVRRPAEGGKIVWCTLRL
jgi:anti-anti-sigma factor